MTRARLLCALVAIGGCGRSDRPARTDPAPGRDAAAALDAVAPDAAAPVDPRVAIDRAATWLAAFPADQLRFDAAIGLSQLVRNADSEPARRAYAAARALADRDTDSPLRRAFDDAARVEPGSTTAWTVPGPGEPRANVNRVVAEALHCADAPVRDATLAYVTGPMRDGGGYHTAHGLWALTAARDRGCLAPARFAALAAPLVDELRAAQPAAPDPAVLATDLYAERLLMLALAGSRDAAVDGWARALIRAQAADGSFGALGPGDDPYFRFHATLAAAWALSVWAPHAAP